VGNTLKVDLPLIELVNIIVSNKDIRSIKRIGPHNKDILEFIQGSLLGDGYLEQHGNGSRLCLEQEASNKAYLLWSHNFLAERGYCNQTLPLIKSRIGNKGKIRYTLRIKTWTYTSLNEMRKKYYLNNKKI
jgi:ubiquinol-cytochrome c reductase cytochrome b subunit